MKLYLTRGDIILVAALTVFSLAGFGRARLSGFSGNHAVVEAGGRRVMELPLDRDDTVTVDGPVGKTTIEVKDRAVSITDSPCPRGFCMHMGKIRHPGEILVCVPNRVCVSIKGNGSKDRTFDGISE